MCIRDRGTGLFALKIVELDGGVGVPHPGGHEAPTHQRNRCLLYTSDAADERSSVDLGGRRIIKKKNKKQYDDGAKVHKRNDTVTHASKVEDTMSPKQKQDEK